MCRNANPSGWVSFIMGPRSPEGSTCSVMAVAAGVEDPFQCPDCQKKFTYQQNVNRHWKNVHMKVLSSLQLPFQVTCDHSGKKKPTTENSSPNDEENCAHGSFTCPLSCCNEIFVRVKDLLAHLSCNHNIIAGN
uniref:C2H2-type domain-containing protein n=1 Tax=Amphimedon queenslandica TaxID=400682 RepID=A0A1X7VJH5_AMPQE